HASPRAEPPSPWAPRAQHDPSAQQDPSSQQGGSPQGAAPQVGAPSPYAPPYQPPPGSPAYQPAPAGAAFQPYPNFDGPTQRYPGGPYQPTQQLPGTETGPGTQGAADPTQGGVTGNGQPGPGQPGYQLFSGPAEQDRQPDSRRKWIFAGLALALVGALVGGGLGGMIGYQVAANGGRLSVLDAPSPDADSTAAPPTAVEQVSQRTLPTVVQIRVTSGRQAGAGSGMVLSPDGLILTNNHVVSLAANGGTLNVLFQDGKVVPAKIIGRDKTFDIAVVKAQNVSGLQPITLGNSDSVRVGQAVIAIGSPLGLGGTVTSGIVSALDRAVSVGGDDDTPPPPAPRLQPGPGPGLGDPTPDPDQNSSEVLNAIQTDASINPGNSGGPLVDLEGKVIGMNTAIASLASSGQGGSVGLGFSIPINQVKRVAQELEQTGHATKAVIGVKIETRNQSGQSGGISQAVVVDVGPGSPAQQANLKVGDVIAKVDQRPVTSADEVVAAVISHAPGDKVVMTLGDGRTLPVTLGGQPSS
ncbi:MAG: putative serine protease PepD, partial [Pseudonocardiales bacterium]|nr:putative serine protease PepD [Pseudonocardiales bacterium]